ncbi:hypothetical protein, partial [Devosia insulae]|uniref:hypothetical protein n=1 Tax=Devosia insulae TaxID=408174 RepID=UPI00159F1D6A
QVDVEAAVVATKVKVDAQPTVATEVNVDAQPTVTTEINVHAQPVIAANADIDTAEAAQVETKVDLRQRGGREEQPRDADKCEQQAMIRASREHARQNTFSTLTIA